MKIHEYWHWLADMISCLAIGIVGIVIAVGSGFAVSLLLGMYAGMIFAMFVFVAFIADQIIRMWPDVREIKRENDRRKEEAERCSARKQSQSASPGLTKTT